MADPSGRNQRAKAILEKRAREEEWVEPWKNAAFFVYGKLLFLLGCFGVFFVFAWDLIVKKWNGRFEKNALQLQQEPSISHAPVWKPQSIPKPPPPPRIYNQAAGCVTVCLLFFLISIAWDGIQQLKVYKDFSNPINDAHAVHVQNSSSKRATILIKKIGHELSFEINQNRISLPANLQEFTAVLGKPDTHKGVLGIHHIYHHYGLVLFDRDGIGQIERVTVAYARRSDEKYWPRQNFSGNLLFNRGKKAVKVSGLTTPADLNFASWNKKSYYYQTSRLKVVTNSFSRNQPISSFSIIGGNWGKEINCSITLTQQSRSGTELDLIMEINGRQMSLPNSLSAFRSVLGPPSRIFKRSNTIHTYDDLGILLYERSNTNLVIQVTVAITDDDDIDFWPRKTFSGIASFVRPKNPFYTMKSGVTSQADLGLIRNFASGIAFFEYDNISFSARGSSYTTPISSFSVGIQETRGYE